MKFIKITYKDNTHYFSLKSIEYYQFNKLTRIDVADLNQLKIVLKNEVSFEYFYDTLAEAHNSFQIVEL